MRKILLVSAGCLALTACATDGYYRDGYVEDRYYEERYVPVYEERVRYEDRYARCDRCGVVERIEVFHGRAQTTGAGAITGAIVGGALGNQVGSGSGRRAATVAGAVAGGFAGNAIERDLRDGERFDLHVRMDDGRRVVVSQDDLEGVREGSRVVVVGGRARLM